MVDALPPSITGTPPVGASPASQPSGNPGAAANGMAGVRTAVQILQSELPKFPIGSDLHKAVMTAITSLSRHAPEAEASPGVQQTALAGAQQQSQQQAPMQALMSSMGGGGGGMPPMAGGGQQPDMQ